MELWAAGCLSVARHSAAVNSSIHRLTHTYSCSHTDTHTREGGGGKCEDGSTSRGVEKIPGTGVQLFWEGTPGGGGGGTKKICAKIFLDPKT